MEEGLRGMESSGPAFVTERPAVTLVQPAAEEHDRGEAEGDPSMMDSKAYAHWRKTGETSPELFDPKPKEESGDVLDNLTAPEYDTWRLTGKLPEKPSTSKVERFEKETSAARGEASMRESQADVDPMQSVREHVSKITPEVHQKNVGELTANLERELKSMPDGQRIADASGSIPTTPKFTEFLKHGLADLPNSAGVFRFLAGHGEIVKQMQTLTPDAAVGALHEISAHVAAESRFKDRIQASRALFKDFDAVALASHLPIREASPVASYVLHSGRGTEVLYQLGKNPSELDRINRLMPVAQYRELARIEASLPNRGPNRISKAPPPPRTVNATSTAGSDEVFQALKDDNFEDYRAKANARDMARARR